MISNSLAIVGSFFLVLFILFLLKSKLADYLIDIPNARSSHMLPTPRGGGIAFAAVTCACSMIAFLCGNGSFVIAVPLLAAPLALVGFLDDRYSLPAPLRYGVQLLTGVFILVSSPLVQGLSLSLASFGLLLLPVFIFLAIAVTAIINFTNFMDGLDGLVAGCMAVIIPALAIVLDAPWPLWALVGSLLGFLFWNWSPAKVFMGDVGSTFLGAVFAGLVLHSTSWSEAFFCLLVATPLLGDAFFCVIRRLFNGQCVFRPHRLHLFQRLHQAGWTHARVSLTYIAATSVLSVAILAGGWSWLLGLAVLEVFVGLWLDRRVAVPFLVASKC